MMNPATGATKPRTKLPPQSSTALTPAQIAQRRGAAPKPGERRGGRKAGTPNKRTAELRELAAVRKKPGTRQRTEIWKHVADARVRGNFYIRGKRVQRVLCSFAAVGLDPDGNPIKPGEMEAKRIEREIGARRAKMLTALQLYMGEG